MNTLVPARLRPADVIRVGAAGLRTRPLRAFLSALGIAVGIGAMVAVLGISASGSENLTRSFDALGTNLLTVAPGTVMLSDKQASLPTESVAMVRAMDHVESVTATGAVDAQVYRNDRIPTGQSGGIAALAARTDLLDVLGATVATGSWLTDATTRFPTVVLGARTARLLGVASTGHDVQIWLGARWFTVIGILRPITLTPELDYAAFVGQDVARTHLGFDDHPTTIYVRAADNHVQAVQRLLAPTTNPRNPIEVKVSRPSDALAARRVADNTFTGLLLGLGAVALLVGGIGVANTMVISVLERRAEIGLRRSLGATRGQIRGQFLTESLILSVLGGAGGVMLGIAVTAIYATSQAWPTVLPAVATAGGLVVPLLIGGLAGIYPAVRASRLPPTEALATP